MAEMRSAENRFLVIGETTSRAEDGEGLSRAAPVVGEGFILDVLVLEVYSNRSQHIMDRRSQGKNDQAYGFWMEWVEVLAYVFRGGQACWSLHQSHTLTGCAIMPFYLKWRTHASLPEVAGSCQASMKG